MSQNTKPKQQQKRAIRQTNEGQLISPVGELEADTTVKKAKKLGLGSVLDDLRSMDMRPSRRR